MSHYPIPKELTVANSFSEIVRNRHDYARQWKARTGGKVLGYFCTWVPEEIFHAAGFLPVRIMGSHESNTDVVERHIYGPWCSFCRDCLAQGLLGRYEYLDAIAMPHQGCYHMRHAFDAWRRHVPVLYSFNPFTPTAVHKPSAQAYLPLSYSSLRNEVESAIGTVVSEEALNKSIEVYDRNRRLIREVYELRKPAAPAVTGLGAMQIVLASMLMDKDEHSILLTELLRELQTQERQREAPRVRLILIGSETDQPELFELIESLGADVVVDENCVGTRYFWNTTREGADAITRIADRYLSKPLCAIYDQEENRRRIPFIKKLAAEWSVGGAILVQMKFCDSHDYDMQAIKSSLEGMGIPAIVIETDVTVPVGPFRTRIEAHLEMLELEFA